jgi:hypothetical protein
MAEEAKDRLKKSPRVERVVESSKNKVGEVG